MALSKHVAMSVDAALIAAIEHIRWPAFAVTVVTRRVVAANSAGRVWLTAQPSVRSKLTGVGGPCSRSFAVTPSTTGHYYLAVRREPPHAVGIKGSRWQLTRREHQVAALVIRGATNRDIADALGCAVKTVEQHVSNILRKVKVENRASLIVALLEEDQSSPLPHSKSNHVTAPATRGSGVASRG